MGYRGGYRGVGGGNRERMVENRLVDVVWMERRGAGYKRDREGK